MTNQIVVWPVHTRILVHNANLKHIMVYGIISDTVSCVQMKEMYFMKEPDPVSFTAVTVVKDSSHHGRNYWF